MRLTVHFRVDTSEFYETDRYEFDADDWNEVARHIINLEQDNTVLSVERVDM